MSYRKMLSSSVLLGITVVLSLSYSRVDAQSDTTDIVSGNISRGGYRLLPSTSASTFLRSIIPQATNTHPHRLRLLNTRLPLNSTHDILLRFALLDTNGNALGGLPTMEQWQWYIRFDSPAEWHYSDTLSPTLYDNLWVSRHLRLAICIDASVNNIAHHSMIAAGMGSLYEALSPFDSVTWILARAQPTIALPMMHQRELSNISQYFQQYCHFGGSTGSTMHSCGHYTTSARRRSLSLLAATTRHHMMLWQQTLSMLHKHLASRYIVWLSAQMLTQHPGKLSVLIVEVISTACTRQMVQQY